MKEIHQQDEDGSVFLNSLGVALEVQRFFFHAIREERGNIIFPFFDGKNEVDSEQFSLGFKRLASKGVWNNFPLSDTVLNVVFCISAMECIAYAHINNNRINFNNIAFFAVGVNPNSITINRIKELFPNAKFSYISSFGLTDIVLQCKLNLFLNGTDARFYFNDGMLEISSTDITKSLSIPCHEITLTKFCRLFKIKPLLKVIVPKAQSFLNLLTD